jgi:tetratricopeptide (TPR) repeat protein
MPFLLLIISFFIGLYLYSQIIFPILYLFPKSIYLVIKREIKPISILMSLITPIFYFVLFFALGFFFPSLITNKYVMNPYVSIGSNISIVVLLYRGFLTKKGRSELNEDFLKFVEKYKTKPNYEDWLRIGNIFFKNKDYNDARSAYAVAYEAQPQNNAKACLGIGLCCVELGNEKAAKVYYDCLIVDNEIEMASIPHKALREKNMVI